jgi:tetratricopeptide (TPR) repeat protein
MAGLMGSDSPRRPGIRFPLSLKGGLRLQVVALLAFAGMQAGTLSGKEMKETRDDPSRAEAPDSSMRAFSHGSFLAMKGDYWGAIDVFRKIVPKRPEDLAAVRYSISRAFYSLSVPDSARVHGEAAVRLDPVNMHYARHLAGIVHEMQDYNRAAELYGQAAQLEPDRLDLLYSQALEYMAARRPVEALDTFGRLLNRDPLDEKALAQSLWIQIALKRYPDAINTQKQLSAVVGKNQKLDLTLGELYELTGQPEKALETFRGIISADRNAVPAWVALLDHYIKSGNRDELLREYRAFDNLSAADAGSAIELARVFAARADSDSLYVGPVFSMLDDLIVRHPRDSRIHVLKGVFEMTRKQSARAIVSFKMAVALDHGNIDAWENLVMAYLDRKDRSMAFSSIARAKRVLPREAARMNFLEGYALLHSGSPARAASVLETLLTPGHRIKDHELLIRANVTLAMACDQLGRKKRSAEVYSRVLELDPHNVMAMNNLAYLYAEEAIMLQKALRLSQNAVMLDPENGVFLDTLGWVNYRLGRFAIARDVLEKAVATGIGEPEIYGHLGAVYQKLGEGEKAKEMFDRARVKKK